MIPEDQRINNTESFLKLLAYRLSGRDDLKQTEYEVRIDNKGHVVMNPLVYVYPNRHNRKETDKLDILSFILTMMVGARDFVPGTYIYKLSSDRKRRKWTKGDIR